MSSSRNRRKKYPNDDIIEVARLIFKYLRSSGQPSRLNADLIKLIFSMPPVFDMDGLALATAVLADPGPHVHSSAAKQPPSLWTLRQDRTETQIAPRATEVNFRRLPNLAIVAIQEILLDGRYTPLPLRWGEYASLDDE